MYRRSGFGVWVVLAAASSLAAPALADDAPRGPWSALPKSFHGGLDAASSRGAGVFIVFEGARSVLLAPSGEETTSEVFRWPVVVDAAVAWDTDRTLLFSGRTTFLVNHEDASVIEEDIAKLGLPLEWTNVNAAARYDAEHWILFRGKESILYRLPTEEAPGFAVRAVDIEDWLDDWGSGIDAAVSLPGARLALFRGRRFKLIDLAEAEISPSLAYAGPLALD